MKLRESTRQTVFFRFLGSMGVVAMAALGVGAAGCNLAPPAGEVVDDTALAPSSTGH